MRTTAHDGSMRRAIVVGALVTLTIGGLLWGTRLLASGASTTTASISVASATLAVVPKAAVAGAAPLPTIVQPSSTGSTVPPTAVGPAAVGEAQPATTTTPAQVATATADLAPRLRKHLSCLAPGTRYDATLDAVAAEQARQDNTPLPKQGTIQIAAHDRQHILVAANQLADLSRPDGRCGETLIFGIPPLDWLPNGARFGLGVDMRADGVVIVVVTA